VFATRFRLTCHMIGAGFQYGNGFFSTIQYMHSVNSRASVPHCRASNDIINSSTSAWRFDTFSLVEPYELKHGAAVSHPCASGHYNNMHYNNIMHT